MRDLLRATAIRLSIGLLSLLPIGWARSLGSTAADVAWRLRARPARVTRSNLAACFPGTPAPDLDRLAQASLRATGRLLGELGMVAFWPEWRWRRLIAHVEGAELLDTRSSERGVLLLVPHFGNWELLNLYLGRAVGLVAMYEPPRIAALDEFIRARRRRTGSTLVPTTPAGVRALYRALEGGRVVAVLPDQVPDAGAGEIAPFFGVAALTMRLPHRLARRTGARVVLGSAVRRGDGRFDLRFEDVTPAVGVDSAAASTAALNGAIERLVACSPEQYQWEYKRFRAARRPRRDD